MKPVLVEVLLATYNGERFLEEQLDSILGQSYPNFHIQIRDDGSTDRTMDILRTYERRYPEKMFLNENTGESRGAIQNFSKLIQMSSAPYVMLSDQDDVWLPEKISVSLKKITDIEDSQKENLPVLVHTDLKVVDEELALISTSFIQFSGFKPSRVKFKNILVQNVITGSTMMMNRALADISAPIPPQALMHDWWIALAASSMGKICFIQHPTILYRQHGENALGARAFNLSYIWFKARNILKGWGESILLDNIVQARAFQERFAGTLTPDKVDILNSFSSLENLDFFSRRTMLIRQNFLKGNFSQNLGLFLRI